MINTIRDSFELLERITDGFFALDEHWNFTYMNAEASRLLFRHRDDLVGKNVWSEFPEAVDLPFYEHYHRAVREQVPVTFDAYFAPLKKWFEVRSYPSSNGLSVYFKDITSKKMLLAQTEQHYKSLFDQNQDAVFSFDLSGNYLSVNPAMERMLGYREEEFLQQSFVPLVCEEDLERTIEHYEKAATGIIQRYQTKTIHKNGSIVYVDVTNMPIVVNREVVGVYGIAKDITDRHMEQEELATTKEHLQSYIDNTSDGIAVFDLEGHVLRVNPAFEKMFGWLQHEIKGKRLAVTPIETKAHAEYLLRETKLGNHVHGFETVKQCKNGRLIHVSITMSPIRNRQGDIIELVGTVRDIHERKMMDIQLKESEQRYRLTIENSLNLITRHDLNENYLYASPSCYEITGYESYELLGQEVERFIYGEDMDKVRENFVRLIHDNIIEPVIYRYHKKDGTLGWLESIGRAIPDLNTGKVKEIVVISKDISKQQELIVQLKESNEIFEIIAQHSQDVFIIAEPNGVVQYVSPAITKMLGYDTCELMNKHLMELRHPLDELFCSDVLSTSDIGTFEGRIRHKEGHYVPFETTIKLVRDVEGNGERLVGVARDVTERKSAQHYMILTEKLSTVSQLAAGIAHEIRNPLTVINGFIKLIRNKFIEESYYFDIMVEEIKRVNLILNELLVLSKPKGNEFKISNISILLSHVATLLRSHAIIYGIEIIETYKDTELEILCDENSLKQVFINFIKNAIEAMPNGGEIHLEMECIDEEILIRVVDQGSGISEDQRKKIGTPFYTTKENGTGLGMMICSTIIENHKGQIKIESEVNIGTTLIIKLPKTRSLDLNKNEDALYS